MLRLTGQTRRGAGRGFTLVELLLAVVLLLLLLGALVLSFAPLQRGAALDEGAAQFEGLLRFARAHAAQTGRQVQIRFDEPVEEDFWMALGGLRVVWEPDPLGAPGRLVELTEATPFVRGLTDLVLVEQAQWLEPGAQADEATAPDEDGRARQADEEFAWTFPPITFFPDGSSSSAEVILMSHEKDDSRRMAVRLVGLTGSISRRLVEEAPDREASEPEQGKPSPPTPPEAPAKTAGPTTSAGAAGVTSVDSE
jgi:prepilin-type N-terminal cleavage/methylation domain-containing protein